MSDFQQTEVLMDMHDLKLLRKCVEMAQARDGMRDYIFDERCAEMQEKLCEAMERVKR